MKYAAIVSYDGSKFYGFQRLNDLNTVQKELEKALSILNKKPVVIKGAGRTDRGVHALGQVVNFELDRIFELEKLKKVLNKILSDYIKIKRCVYVDDNFHSRFSAMKKKYIYRIYTGKENPFINDYALVYSNHLDVKKIRKASKMILGAHDFHNFVSGNRDSSDSILYKIKVRKRRNFIIIEFIGKSFYRYMVRNLVGALIEIGANNKDYEYINELLSSQIITPNTASPNGLYLKKVYYNKKYKLD